MTIPAFGASVANAVAADLGAERPLDFPPPPWKFGACPIDDRP